MISMSTEVVRAPLSCPLPHRLYQIPCSHLVNPNSALCPKKNNQACGARESKDYPGQKFP